MKQIFSILAVTFISMASYASQDCKMVYKTVFTGEESRTLYASLALKEEMIEYCGPYSGDCPRFLGKELKTENTYMLCFKDSMCIIGVCPDQTK